MEHTLITCGWMPCDNTFIKKRENHRFCCDSHRKKWNRQKKGISILPSFFKSKEKPIHGVNNLTFPNDQIVYDYDNPVIEKGKKTNLKWLLPIVALGLSKIRNDDDINTIFLTGAAHYLGKILDKKNERREFKTYQVLPNKTKKIRSRKTKSTKKRIMSGTEYTKTKIDSIGMKGKYKYLFGDPGHGFYMLVTGMPGNGKSTFAIKLGQYFQENHGKVLFLAGEQSGMNKPLQELLKINGVTFDIDTKPSKNAKEIAKIAKGYSMLIIDSVNHLNLAPYDIRDIKKALPSLSIVGIMQSTKEGNFKGSQEYLHDCDIRINCIEMVALQTKSRFAAKSEIPILD